MVINAIAILELSSSLKEFIEFLKTKGFYTTWMLKDSAQFALPSNCAWRQFNAPDGTPDAQATKSAIDTMQSDITEHFKEFTLTPRYKEVILEKLLTVPAKPWASLSNIKADNDFDGWDSEQKQKAFQKFCEGYKTKKPEATDQEMRDIFELANS